MNTTKQKKSSVSQDEVSSISIYGPMSVMCWTKLIVTDQEEFLSNFPNNVFDQKVFQKLISQGGHIEGTYISEQEIDETDICDYDMKMVDLKIEKV